MKDSIIFYLSHYEVVKQLDNEQLGKLYRALFELALGNEPKVDEDIKIPFGFIKNQMVLDIEKYNEKRMKNKENGKLGGRPKKNATEEIEKPKKANGFFENPNDNENDNENENENENDNVISLCSTIEKNFGRTLAPLEYDVIKSWIEVENVSEELVVYATQIAVCNNACSVKYIERILQDWKRKNLLTLDQAKKENEKFKNKRELPDWWGKEFERKEPPPEKKKEIENLLKEFGGKK